MALVKSLGFREISCCPFFKVIEESGILPHYTLSREPRVAFAADAAARYHCGLGCRRRHLWGRSLQPGQRRRRRLRRALTTLWSRRPRHGTGAQARASGRVQIRRMRLQPSAEVTDIVGKRAHLIGRDVEEMLWIGGTPRRVRRSCCDQTRRRISRVAPRARWTATIVPL